PFTLNADPRERRGTLRTSQRISQQLTFIDDSLAFQIPLPRECHRRLNDSVRRFLLDAAYRFFASSDRAVRLIAESLRYLSMALLHLVVRQVELGLTCFVRRNLRCVCSSLFLFLKV